MEVRLNQSVVKESLLYPQYENLCRINESKIETDKYQKLTRHYFI